jgi:hypothetical protein
MQSRDNVKHSQCLLHVQCDLHRVDLIYGLLSFIPKIACASQRHCCGRNMTTVGQSLFSCAGTPYSCF